MGRDAEGVRKAQGGAVKDELTEYRWGMILSQNATHWLYLGNAVHELREEPAPDLMGGPADNQDMFRWWRSLFSSWLVEMFLSAGCVVPLIVHSAGH